MSRRISAGQPDKPGHLSELRGNGIAVLTFALLSTPLNLPAFGLGITSSVLLLCFSRPEDIHIEAPRISRLALGTAIFAGLAAALGLVVGVFGASNVCNAVRATVSHRTADCNRPQFFLTVRHGLFHLRLAAPPPLFFRAYRMVCPRVGRRT